MSEVKIHHAVVKKAAKHNITIVPPGEGETLWKASHADLTDKAEATTPSEVLEAALQALGYKKPKREKKPAAPRVAGKPKTKKAKGKKQKAAKAGIIANKSVVKKVYKEQYKTKGSGQGNGDRLDIAMKDALEADDNALGKIAKENGIQFNWGILNKGLQRMNLSNVLRGRIDRGEPVKVLGKSIASL